MDRAKLTPIPVSVPALRVGQIAVLLHGSEKSLQGGPSVRVPRTAEELRNRGYFAQVLHFPDPSILEADLLHGYNVWPPNTALALVRRACHLGKPFIFSPIFIDLSGMQLWDQDIPHLFSEIEDIGTIDARLGTLVAQHRARDTLADRPAEALPGHHDMVREMIASSDHVILLSDHERVSLEAIGAYPRARTLIRNPVDHQRYGRADPALFIETYGVKDFVLCVARIEPRKNQLLLLHALFKTKLPIVLIGHHSDTVYFNALKRYVGPNVHILGRIDSASDLIPSAYAASRVTVLPSWAEGAPLAALEAGASGASLVLSDRSSEREYFGTLARYCNPADPGSIRSAVLEAYEATPESAGREAQKSFIAEQYSWDRHVHETLAVYHRTIEAFTPHSRSRFPVTSATAAQDAEIERLNAQLAQSDRWAKSLEAQAITIQADLARKDQELSAQDAEIQTLNARLADNDRWAKSLEAQAIAIQGDVACKDQAIAAQNAEIEKLKDRLAAVYRSISWRITSPLRLLSGAARTPVFAFPDFMSPRRGFASLAAAFGAGFLKTRELLKVIARASRIGNILLPANSALQAADAEPPSVRLVWQRLQSAKENCTHLPVSGVRRENGRLRLAYVSPLPPARTGVAEYSAELLPALAHHYEIDVIVAQTEVSDSRVKSHCAVRDVNRFERYAHTYDRIIYHIGNSTFHHHMFPLLEKYPGVVVLHDFYLGDLLRFLEVDGGWKGWWTQALYAGHGYGALRERFAPDRLSSVVQDYPASLFILQQAQGIIVHSEHSQSLVQSFYGLSFGGPTVFIPHLRRLPQALDRGFARKQLGLDEGEFVVAAFGVLGDTKQNHRLLNAWISSSLGNRNDCKLVFVGDPPDTDYVKELKRAIVASGLRNRVKITGFAHPALYHHYLCAADVAVQLRTRSRGESSGTVLDSMAYGLPVIVNAHGSMAELPDTAVLKLPDDFTDSELTAAIEALMTDPERRAELGQHARSIVAKRSSPVDIASHYQKAIERFTEAAPAAFNITKLAALVTSEKFENAALLQKARELARAAPIMQPLRQLLVDVSATARQDLKTGIQRVVKGQLIALFENPPAGFRIEPVWLVEEHGRWFYRYARGYTCRLLGLGSNILNDHAAEVADGDILYVPDYFTDGVVHATKAGIYADWRQRGIEISFMIHDLLPLLRPECFPSYSETMHMQWLSCIAESCDRVICISDAVANDVRHWLEARKPQLLKDMEIVTLHHGSDIEAAAPSKGLPGKAQVTLNALSSRPSFLMVGTIEPRKGYSQAISAFERLWVSGIDIALIIVGPEGWKHLPPEQRQSTLQVVAQLRGHPELGKRLFWLEGISDEYLERLYTACTCLVAASENEGFGLPLIEAARHKLPIIARDIPVFREVAGAHASYFGGTEPHDLVCAIENWLALYSKDGHPKSDDMPWITWAENVERLKAILLEGSSPEG